MTVAEPSSGQSGPARLMPAEWERHDATWIAWPHQQEDWPGRFEPIPWVYADIVRVLAASERVEILCPDEAVAVAARTNLDRVGVSAEAYRLHLLLTDRGWLRDSAPTAVRRADGQIEWIRWQFNAWAKYDNYVNDRLVPEKIRAVTGLPMSVAMRPDRPEPLVLEGGAIETDGQGTLLVTEECLLSAEQCRNPGLDRQGYEHVFHEYLGITRTIWLGRGCSGDDTHGHIDDIARFVGPATVVLAVESDKGDANHDASQENLARLRSAVDACGRHLRVIPLPMPEPVIFEGQRLPASYANFYIANRVVLVPTFNDARDRIALNILAECFPDRQVVGIHARDLVWGLGTLHCLSQQQPAR